MKVIYLRILLLFFVLSPLLAMAQGRVVRGIVTDATGPLMGATVFFQNKENRTLNGVTTDRNGEYLIKVPVNPDLANIVFSFIGYKTKSIKYTNQTNLNILLAEDMKLMDEVNVVAKAINKDAMGMNTKALGGARQKIDMDEFQDMTVTSIEDMLQGKMVNLDIIASSGAPGSKSSIRIRGTASLNSSNEPLIVIDGVPQSVKIASDFNFGTATEEDYGSLVNISPSDIQSIEVLKDASATAIWGAQAANGVLVITTKRGTKSKPTFSITQKISTSIEPKRMPMLNGKEYVTLMQDARWNRIRDDEYGDMSLLTKPRDILYDPTYPYFQEFSKETDWLDYVVQTPINSETDFSMSGGGDKASYRFSIGYLTERGTTVGEDFKRITARLNLDYRFSDRFTIRSLFSYAEGDRNSSTFDGSYNPRAIAANKMPNLTPFVLDADGNMTDEYFTPPSESIQGAMANPIALARDARNNSLSRDMGVNFNIEYTVISDLRFVADVAFNLNTSKQKKFLPSSALIAGWSEGSYNKGAEQVNNSNTLYVNTGFNYYKMLGDHTFSASVRFQAKDVANGSYFAQTAGNANINVSDPSANGKLMDLNAGESQNRWVALVESFSYSYKSRLNLNAAFRTDGNSNTGRNSRWGTFPSLSASYYMHEESFLKQYEWIYEVKPRVGWGRSGGSPSGSSTYAGTFTAMDQMYVDMTAITPNSMQLDKLKWETTTQMNYGLDLGFFNDNVHFSFDYYTKRTRDLLQENMTIQSSTGYSTVPWFNDGSLENKGWEIVFRMRDVVNYAGFKLGVDFNFSRNRNTVLDLPATLEYQVANISNGAYANKVMEDRPLGSFYGFRYLGVYQNFDETIARDRFGNVIKDVDGKNITTRINGTYRQRPGDAKYMDQNYDGIIDKYDIVYLGNSMPLMIGGGSVTLNYKGFNVRASLAYRIGQSVINMARLNAESMSNSNNQSTSVLRRWRYEGDDTEIPRALYGTQYNSLGSDRYVEKASFLKFKDITFSYRFPRQLAERLSLRGLYVYLTSYDPFTITSYKGQDPEVGIPSKFDNLATDNSMSPRPRRFAFGVTVDF